MAGIRAAKPRRARYVLWDGDVIGFGVVVLPTGRKSYIFKYRNAGGTVRKPKLGSFPAMKVKDARELARRWGTEARGGADPSRDRAVRRRVETVAQLCARFMAEHVRPMLKPRTVKLYEDLWRLHVPIRFQSLKLDAVTRRTVEQLHRRIGKKHEVTANRTLQLLSAMFGWAVSRDLLPGLANPARGVKHYRERGRERFLSGAERSRLNDALHAAETTPRGRAGYVSPGAVACLKLLAATGARLSEIVDLTWQEVDLERRILRLRDSKTGEKTVPLSPAAVEILRRLRAGAVVGVALVVVSERGTKLTNMQRAWQSIRRRAGLDDLRIHDLRHSAASDALAAGVSVDLVGCLLGHQSAQTTRRYAHLAPDVALRAAEAMGAEMERRAEGGAGDGGARSSVLPFSAADPQ